jgi:nucleotide-binding universal stress UspA family protein
MRIKVLLPSDGSPASMNAARRLARDLKGRNASVLVVNVQPVYVDAELVHLGAAILNVHRHAGETALRGAIEILAAAGITHEARVAFGPVAEVIARMAKETVCDLVVMGTRARHPLVELFARAVPARVLRLSDVPVALVRHQPAQDERTMGYEPPFIAA